MKNLLLTLFALSILGAVSAQSTAQELYDKAYTQLKSGVNVTELLYVLEECMEIDKSFEEAYMLRAYVYYKLEDYEAAIKDYDRLLQINPKHEEALKKRAVTKLLIGDYDGALADQSKRLNIDDTDASIVYFDRAYCKGVMGDKMGAINDYSKAIELNYNFRAAYLSRGIAQLNMASGDKTQSFEISENICKDFEMASSLGDATAMHYLSNYCQ